MALAELDFTRKRGERLIFGLDKITQQLGIQFCGHDPPPILPF